METRPGRPRHERRGEHAGLTDDDRLMLAFAAEQRFVLGAQLAALTGVDEAIVDGRLRALTAAGYLREARRPAERPAARQVTPAGLRAIGSDLRAPPRVALGTFDHELAAGWLMLAARRGRFGPAAAVVGERRMRSHDARLRGQPAGRAERFGVRIDGFAPGGGDRLHYPDMVMLTRSGHRVAFELELSHKSRGRREAILAAYASDPRIDSIVYLVGNRSTGAAIERAAARFGMSEIVHVQLARLGPEQPAASRAPGAARRHSAARAPADAGVAL